MKATGIVRRIDDLGRVVIPKEIRRTLRLREAHSFRNIYRQRRRNHTEKVFSDGGTFEFCETICRLSGSKQRPHRLHFGQGPDYCHGRNRRQGYAEPRNQ